MVPCESQPDFSGLVSLGVLYFCVVCVWGVVLMACECTCLHDISVWTPAGLLSPGAARAGIGREAVNWRIDWFDTPEPPVAWHMCTSAVVVPL